MPHAALCVLGPSVGFRAALSLEFQCRTQHDVCWDFMGDAEKWAKAKFQCRTQHNVCWDLIMVLLKGELNRFNTARSIVCVGTYGCSRRWRIHGGFNAARGIMCVGTEFFKSKLFNYGGFNTARSIMCVGTSDTLILCTLPSQFQCRPQHYVCWDARNHRGTR